MSWLLSLFYQAIFFKSQVAYTLWPLLYRAPGSRLQPKGRLLEICCHLIGRYREKRKPCFISVTSHSMEIQTLNHLQLRSLKNKYRSLANAKEAQIASVLVRWWSHAVSCSTSVNLESPHFKMECGHFPQELIWCYLLFGQTDIFWFPPTSVYTMYTYSRLLP